MEPEPLFFGWRVSRGSIYRKYKKKLVSYLIELNQPFLLNFSINYVLRC